MYGTLAELLIKISPDTSWGIWAEPNERGLFSPDARARIGQTCFDDGGMRDGMSLVCTGEQAHYDFVLWHDGVPEEDDIDPSWPSEFLQKINEEILESR